MADEAVNEDRRILGMYQLDFLENGRNRILLTSSKIYGHNLSQNQIVDVQYFQYTKFLL